MYCGAVTSISIPNTVTEIGVSSFNRCVGLTSLHIPNSVLTIEEAAFYHCENLESVLLSNSVTSIGRIAFSYCKKLNSIAFPNTLQTIGNNAFQYCDELKEIFIPNSVSSIGNEAFDCYVLNTIEVEDENITYDSRGGCNALIETSTNTLLIGCRNTVIPNTVTQIGDYAFYFVDFTSLTIPYSVTTIGNNSFAYCRNLKNIVFPNALTSIGKYAFENCEELNSITFPSTVTNIGYCAFRNCSNLNSIITLIENVFAIEGNVFSSDTYSTATLYIIKGLLSTYRNTNGWKNFNSIVEFEPMQTSIVLNSEITTFSSVRSIDFHYCEGLKAYIASGFKPSTGELLLTRIYEAPANVGLLLKGQIGEYELPYATTDIYYSNLLKCVTSATTILPQEGNYTNFFWSDGSHGIGFYPLSEATDLAAGTSYLQLPTSALGAAMSHGIILQFEEEGTATAITERSVQPIEDVYDLQGRRLSKKNLSKGLYIVNGKKLFTK